MAANEILLNKAATIERCVTRIRTERSRQVSDEIAQTVEDSIVLNIQRACEASIDAAMHVVRLRELVGQLVRAVSRRHGECADVIVSPRIERRDVVGQ